MANKRRVRAACRGLLRGIDVQPPLQIMDLVPRVAALRGRPIQLVEHPLTDELALSFNVGDIDVIAWRQHTSTWHRDHSIAHELGHILCRHLDPDAGGYGEYDATESSDLSAILARFPHDGPPPQAIRRRACYGYPHEATVELIATTFLEWAILPGRAPEAIPQDLVRGHGLYRTLSYRRGWT
ncbi:hypothetical protein [uncultured Pseudonocardia sp.]|uniref:hypothetical protein n=1 Tax=uncultured Pseudonocardia sp. TaxID=211455 RepID=UPI002635EF36|nr:hypothetical protein [uncultured Pseudonocardia sp.]